MIEGTPSPKRIELEKELKRIKAKRSEIKDKDVRDALTLRIEAIEQELGTLNQALLEDEGSVEAIIPEVATPEQEASAEVLIRQARVEAMRKNFDGATSLLRQAEAIAPGSALVLEFLGDSLVEQNHPGEALKKYALALKLAPSHVGVAKKHADLVFNVKARDAGLALAATYAREEYATAGSRAMWFSLICPGLGQVLVGEAEIGYTVIVMWVICLAWIILLNAELKGLLKDIGFNPAGIMNHGKWVFIPVIIGACLVIYSVLACKMVGATSRSRVSKTKITPPVNLPFD